MPKPGFIPQKLRPWIEARKRYRLSHAQVQMARELGLTPKSLGKLSGSEQQPWKLPLRQFIEARYEKQFGRRAPLDTRSIEQKARAERARREAKKRAKRESEGPGAPTPPRDPA